MTNANPKKIMKEVVDLLFPIDCLGCEALGRYLCDGCKAALEINSGSTCFDCGKETLLGSFCSGCAPLHALDRLLIAAEYDQELVHKLIWNLKFAGVKDIAGDLAGLAASYLNSNFVLNILNIAADAVLVPIPVHAARLKERGYNQAELIAQSLGSLIGIPAVSLLERSRDTRTQLGRDKQSRWKSLEGVFNAVPGAEFPRTVILLDDVVTTGSTLEHAAQILKSAGVQKVFGLAVAKRGLNK